MFLLLVACQSEEQGVEDPPCGGSGESYTIFLNTLKFTRRTDDGVANGFNLDGYISTASDSVGCYKPDLVSPTGVPGVDSGLSALVPALEATEAAAVEPLIQDSINFGEILIGIELMDVDDLQNDSCVSMRVTRALGPPSLATNGFIEPGQTYERDPDSVAVESTGLAIVDGGVEAGPFEWALPLQVLDTSFELVFHNAKLYTTLGEGGTGEGYFAGGIVVEDIMTFLGGINSDVGDLIGNLFPATADLEADESGTCTQLSAGMDFTTTSGYFFED
jgi:hypothetical protein